jgi:hypothetical protein
MDASSLWPVFLVALALFALAFVGMALGVMLSGRCLRGSCGGPEATGPHEERVSCAHCPNRRKSPAGSPDAASGRPPGEPLASGRADG